MPFDSALAVGVVNAVVLITATAIPLTPAEIAAVIALSICGMFELAEPAHCGVGIPSRAAASCSPYWVGTKNGFVVTWLTKVNFHFGVLGKFPATSFAPVPPPVLVDAVLAELHAVSSADAAAVALTRPVPVSSRRRVGPSFMFSVSIASSTLGSTFLIAVLHFLGQMCVPFSAGIGNMFRAVVQQRAHADVSANNLGPVKRFAL